MKAMADHTQMDPTRRCNRLLEFSKRMHSTEAAVATMNSFNCDLAGQLVTINGRALDQELMLFGGGKT